MIALHLIDNDYRHGEHWYFLGVFSSQGKAEEAAERYTNRLIELGAWEPDFMSYRYEACELDKFSAGARWV